MNLTGGVKSQASGVSISRPTCASLSRILAVVMGLTLLAGCGSGSSTTPTTTTPTPVANTLPVTVNAGPANNAVNFAYVSVRVCNPGGTTHCVTIPDVQVDTGSSGLRILASAPGVSSLNLTPVTGSGNPVYECVQYADGTYLWGPVMQAAVSMAGENATNVPIQIIDSNAAPTNVSSVCNPLGGSTVGTSTALQANGILGIGTAQQDCGILCSASPVLPYYWLCSSSTVCTSAAAVPTAAQVSNPVAFFNGDNNGVMLAMNALGSTSGAASATGLLTFGIGTQTDNALGSANVYPLGLWPSGSFAGYYALKSTYNNVPYPAFMDSASPITYFLDPTAIAVPGCSGTYTNYYCPSSITNFIVSNTGYQGTAVNASIAVGNAQTLLSNSSLTAFSNLAGISGTGPSNDFVEFGLPFFYGKTIYAGIAGESVPSGVPPSAAELGYYAF